MVEVAGSIVSGSPVSAAFRVPPAAGVPVAGPPLGAAEPLDFVQAASTAPRLVALIAATLNPPARRRNDRRDRSPPRKRRTRASARCSSFPFMRSPSSVCGSRVTGEPSQRRPVECRRVLPHAGVSPFRCLPLRPGDPLLQALGEPDGDQDVLLAGTDEDGEALDGPQPVG